MTRPDVKGAMNAANLCHGVFTFKSVPINWNENEGKQKRINWLKATDAKTVE